MSASKTTAATRSKTTAARSKTTAARSKTTAARSKTTAASYGGVFLDPRAQALELPEDIKTRIDLEVAWEDTSSKMHDMFQMYDHLRTFKVTAFPGYVDDVRNAFMRVVAPGKSQEEVVVRVGTILKKFLNDTAPLNLSNDTHRANFLILALYIYPSLLNVKLLHFFVPGTAPLAAYGGPVYRTFICTDPANPDFSVEYEDVGVDMRHQLLSQFNFKPPVLDGLAAVVNTRDKVKKYISSFLAFLKDCANDNLFITYEFQPLFLATWCDDADATRTQALLQSAYEYMIDAVKDLTLDKIWATRVLFDRLRSEDMLKVILAGSCLERTVKPKSGKAVAKRIVDALLRRFLAADYPDEGGKNKQYFLLLCLVYRPIMYAIKPIENMPYLHLFKRISEASPDDPWFVDVKGTIKKALGAGSDTKDPTEWLAKWLTSLGIDKVYGGGGRATRGRRIDRETFFAMTGRTEARCRVAHKRRLEYRLVPASEAPVPCGALLDDRRFRRLSILPSARVLPPPPPRRCRTQTRFPAGDGRWHVEDADVPVDPASAREHLVKGPLGEVYRQRDLGKWACSGGVCTPVPEARRVVRVTRPLLRALGVPPAATSFVIAPSYDPAASMAVALGDWLVVSGGDFYRVQQQAFEATYELAPPARGRKETRQT